MRTTDAADYGEPLATAPIAADPPTADWWLGFLAIFAIFLSSRGGDLSVLLFLVSTGALFFRRINASSHALWRYGYLLLLPALGLASTLWSDIPSVTLKQSAEYLLFFVGMIVLAVRLTLLSFAWAVMSSSLVACGLSLLIQHHDLGNQALTGIMGSKNVLSFVAEVLLLSSIYLLLKGPARLLRLLFCLAAGLVGAGCVALTRSGGAYVSIAIALPAFFGFVALSAMPLFARIALIALAVLAVSPLLMAMDDVVRLAQTFQTQVLHKDATLTGRTLLWTFARTLIAEHPWLGHGMSAFWSQGNLDAEGLWRQFGIGGRAGFNFHNQFVDVLVDLGAIGLATLSAMLVISGGSALVLAVRRPSLDGAFLVALLAALYALLPVETTLMGSWSIYPLVWVCAGVRSLESLRGLRPRTAADPAAPVWRVASAQRLELS